MYLKRLELYGFKSFADRTRLEFGPGITAIVGPNGSGKSNLVDAVRWVLGEQSARQLRGSRMEDVIFAGTETRKGVGLAEVVLVLDNEDGRLPVEFSEVTIARRVDRAGGSDYLLNGTRVRLKDVQELLYDTAIGREAYSIVGQGKIDEVLSARDEDRRGLIEEAAGIVRYKARRREALRRLEEAEQRLVRLRDILRELDDRLAGLTEQAKKAHIYRQLRAELVELETRLYAAQAREAERRLEERRRAAEAVRREAEALRSELEAVEAERSARRREAQEREGALEAARTALLEAERLLESLRTRDAVLAERSTQLAEQEQRLRSQLDELKRRLVEQSSSGRQVEERLAALERELAAAREERAQREREREACRQAVEKAEGALASAREELFAALQQASALRNERQARERERAQAEQRGKRLAERARQLGEERQRLRQEMEAAARRVLDLAAEAEVAAAEERRWQEGRQAARAEAAEAARRVQRLRQQLGETRSRLRLLEEMRREHEGFFEGVRAVLAGRDAGDPAFAEVRGAVAELIRVDPRLERAIEVALGPALQHVVTETAAGAERAIEALKRARAGRATFLPLDTIRPGEPRPEDRGLARQPGAVSWAIDAVEFDPSLRPAMANLLGRILIAADLPAARRLAALSGYRYRIVTLEGDVVHPGGAMTGGHERRRREAPGLLGRERQIESLRQQLDEIARQLQEAEEARRAAEEQAIRAEARIEELRGLRHRREVARAEVEQARAAAARQLARVEASLAEVQAELDDLARAGAPQAEAAIAEQLAAAEERRRAAEEGVAKAEAVLAAARADLERASAAAAQAAARCDTLARERALVAEQAERARRDGGRLAAEVERLQAEVARLAGERHSLAGEREGLAAQQERQAAEVAARREELARLLEARDRAAQRAEELEGRAEEARRRLDRLGERLRHLEVEVARLESERDRLRARLVEEYGVHALDAAGADQEGVQNWQAAERRARELRRRMAELGDVNLAAVEEHERVCERYAFLERHCQDLERAREDLRAVIAEMDREMERLFRVAYDRLREEFRKVFRELFGGGHADLVLGEGDALEAGVQIVAQPPGKKLQHLSLLSGGERALTAIALLLALIRVKPTPFCLLDEIDAALDDRNVERFARYLRRFTDTQFIVITHQKATMAAADTLYGVTMPESGVSRIVSVRLADVAAGGEASAAGATTGGGGRREVNAG
ncbi:MAG: chromosome segregation protein SMC [Bacillota bacterium]|nr:MAG: chromosome segregation protein SMC [Bacillota bacterium]